MNEPRTWKNTIGKLTRRDIGNLLMILGTFNIVSTLIMFGIEHPSAGIACEGENAGSTNCALLLLSIIRNNAMLFVLMVPIGFILRISHRKAI